MKCFSNYFSVARLISRLDLMRPISDFEFHFKLLLVDLPNSIGLQDDAYEFKDIQETIVTVSSCYYLYSLNLL